MNNRTITVEPLARDSFAPFGDVIDDTGPVRFPTNGGDALRIHGLGIADCAAEEGRTLLSLFRVERPTLCDPLQLMERHPISSQAFVPLGRMRFIVVVAEADADPQPDNLRAFVSNGRQGVNYRRATWHHPLIALDAGDFLVVDRAAPGAEFVQDYDEIVLTDEIHLILPA